MTYSGAGVTARSFKAVTSSVRMHTVPMIEGSRLLIHRPPHRPPATNCDRSRRVRMHVTHGLVWVKKA